MPRSTRVIIIFGAVALAMAVLALVFVLFWGKAPGLMPADSPGGVVQRYLIALQQNDQAEAAKYLGPPLSTNNYGKGPPGGPPFLGEPSTYYAGTTWKASLMGVTESGDRATVRVVFEISTSPQAFGSQSFQNYVTYELARQGSTWLIVSQAYSYP